MKSFTFLWISDLELPARIADDPAPMVLEGGAANLRCHRGRDVVRLLRKKSSRRAQWTAECGRVGSAFGASRPRVLLCRAVSRAKDGEWGGFRQLPGTDRGTSHPAV